MSLRHACFIRQLLLIVSKRFRNSYFYLDFRVVFCHQDMYEAEQGVHSSLSEPQLLL